MLKQLALVLAVVIVALLAVVAALTIVNRGPDVDEVGSGETEEPGPRTTVVVSVGSTGRQVEVGCLLPVDGQSPFLVVFESRADATDDYKARVSVRSDNGTISTVVGSAEALRPGERREVLPDPWLDPEGIVGCEVVAIQASDQVILVESG